MPPEGSEPDVTNLQSVEDSKQIGAAITLQDRNPTDSYRSHGRSYQTNTKAAEGKSNILQKGIFAGDHQRDTHSQ
jgi:hypothetical protein